jgi:mono/diheme cytochrome c family protein
MQVPKNVQCRAVTVIISLATLTGQAAHAQAPSVESDAYAITRGGQLYDKWWEVLGTKPPAGSHPSYPSTGKQTGDATFRCKECHGWDYKGGSGAYSKGSHVTGIKGINGKAGSDVSAITAILRDKTHAYTPEMIPDKAMEQLARFVNAGQVDVALYIDSATKKAKGDSARGAGLYQIVCAACHGFDGKLLNFGNEKAPEFVGTLAQDNPWEMLHKIRHGQPNTPMPAWFAFSQKDQVDVLAYTQTLPAK